MLDTRLSVLPSPLGLRPTTDGVQLVDQFALVLGSVIGELDGLPPDLAATHLVHALDQQNPVGAQDSDALGHPVTNQFHAVLP
jgi:hypothetical protein